MKIKSVQKNKALKITMLILVSIIFLFVNKAVCLAASAKVTLSGKETIFEKGDSFTVDIKVNSKESIGDFEGYLTYDADILEFVSEASFIAGGEGLIKISDINVMTGEATKKYVVKFVAKETGSSLIAFRETPSVYDFDTSQSMSVSSNQLKVEVGTKALASSNGDLKELKVNPGKLTPEFTPETTQYSVNVESDVDQMIISSIPSDEKASVSIEGNKELVAGENTIEITVEAESGEKKVYKVTVLKKEADKKEDNEDPDDLDNNEDGSGEYTNNDKTVIISKPNIIKENGDIFYENGYRYQIISPEEDGIVPQGYIKTSILIDNTAIEVYSLEGEPDNEFLLIYAVGPSGNKGLYQYDRLEKTLQRYEGPQSLQQEETENSSNKTDSIESKLVIMGVLLFVLIAVCIVLILNLVQSNAHNKRRDKK
ncbi:MAG: hypothetical protein K0S61_367 [Anaerocolumna sp.]|nr:hypothetical protein [Anaerocolumna sp.]